MDERDRFPVRPLAPALVRNRLKRLVSMRFYAAAVARDRPWAPVRPGAGRGAVARPKLSRIILGNAAHDSSRSRTSVAGPHARPSF